MSTSFYIERRYWASAYFAYRRVRNSRPLATPTGKRATCPNLDFSDFRHQNKDMDTQNAQISTAFCVSMPLFDDLCNFIAFPKNTRYNRKGIQILEILCLIGQQ